MASKLRMRFTHICAMRSIGPIGFVRQPALPNQVGALCVIWKRLYSAKMPVICGQSIVVSCQRIAPRAGASRSDYLNEQWVYSANDQATGKYLVYALDKV